MSDNKQKITRSKITDNIKAVTKETMRDKISFTKTLQSIDEVEDKLLVMIEQEDEPSNARIGAMKALMDSKWKKMDRLLPVLKAIEYTGDIQGDITFRWER